MRGLREARVPGQTSGTATQGYVLTFSFITIVAALLLWFTDGCHSIIHGPTTSEIRSVLIRTRWALVFESWRTKQWLLIGFGSLWHSQRAHKESRGGRNYLNMDTIKARYVSIQLHKLSWSYDFTCIPLFEIMITNWLLFAELIYQYTRSPASVINLLSLHAYQT